MEPLRVTKQWNSILLREFRGHEVWLVFRAMTGEVVVDVAGEQWRPLCCAKKLRLSAAY